MKITIEAGATANPEALLLSYAVSQPDTGYRYGEAGKVFLRIKDQYYIYDRADVEKVNRTKARFTLNLKKTDTDTAHGRVNK